VRKTRASSTSATAGPSPSRSRATTTPAPSSPSRARPPAWAASSATSSPWAPARRPAQLPALRPRWTNPERATNRPDGGRGGRHRPLRQLRRHPHHRRRGGLRPQLLRQPAGQRFCLGPDGNRHDRSPAAPAEGVGNPVFYVGSTTGRDGLAGAASPRANSPRNPRRPARRAGGRSLPGEAPDRGLPRTPATGDVVAGIQDMGAAGLTCSTCETAARGGTGIEIDLDQGPASARRHDPLRDHAQRIPGADAHHRQARAASRRVARSSRNGTSPTPSRRVTERMRRQ
jgi:hypothetical protein